MRLLFVASRFPYPPISGERQRVFSLLQHLSRFHDVTLLSLGSAVADDVAALTAQTGVRDVTLVPHPKWRSLWGVFVALVTGRPLQVGYFSSTALSTEVASMAPNFNAAVFHLIRTSNAWNGTLPAIALLDMCDALSANYEQTIKRGRWWSPWTWVSAIEAPRTRSFEAREVKRFHLTTLVSAIDAHRFGNENERIAVMTNGVNIADVTWNDPALRIGDCIAMVGKMDFFPNQDGAFWFAAHVLPKLPADITLKIVGDCSPALKAKLSRLPRVHVTGRVASIADACRDCFAGIAPLHVATGVQTKVLEYFALGLPSVVSSSVAQGLLPPSRDCVLVADTPDEWVARLQLIRASKENASAMALRARRYVEVHHDWRHIGQAYSDRIDALVAGGGSTHAAPSHNPRLIPR